jgi:hypothetical protein
MPEIISASRYNELQGRIAGLLGVGNRDKGYNQVVDSTSQPPETEVAASHMNTLYTDFEKVYVHINGTTPTTIETVTVDDEITEALYAAYETLITTLENDRFLIDASQASAESAGVNSIKNGAASPWGGTATPQQINHTIDVGFASANERRCFFNAGGQIRFNASIDITSVGGADLAKNQAWETMLDNSGQVQFGRAATATTGSGTAYTIGNEDLTSTYQKIYLKEGDPSGTYAENNWYVEAKNKDDSTITFNIVFWDQDVGSGGADEYVAGVLTSSVSHLRASGTYVSNDAPAYVKTSEL